MTERAAELIGRAKSVLSADGRLGIVGFTTTDSGPVDEPAAHLFSVLMLAWTSEGEVHSEAAYEQMLGDHGFGAVDLRRVPDLPFRILTAGLS